MYISYMSCIYNVCMYIMYKHIMCPYHVYIYINSVYIFRTQKENPLYPLTFKNKSQVLTVSKKTNKSIKRNPRSRGSPFVIYILALNLRPEPKTSRSVPQLQKEF